MTKLQNQQTQFCLIHIKTSTQSNPTNTLRFKVQFSIIIIKISMNSSQMRDILEISSKLESTFRHIRYLCGQYIQLQNGQSPSYAPFNQFGVIPPAYPPNTHFGQDLLYPTQKNGNSYQRLQPSNPSVVIKKPITNEPGQKGIKPSAIMSRPMNQPMKQPKKQVKEVKKVQKTQPQVLPNSKMQKSQPKVTNQPTETKGEGVMGGFEYFLRSKREQIKKDFPQLSDNDLIQILKEVWTALSEEEKNEYKKKQFLQRPKIQVKAIASQITKSIKNQLFKG